MKWNSEGCFTLRTTWQTKMGSAMASRAFAEDNPGAQLTLGDLHLRVKARDSRWDTENGRIRPASCRLEVQILPSAMARPASCPLVPSPPDLLVFSKPIQTPHRPDAFVTNRRER